MLFMHCLSTSSIGNYLIAKCINDETSSTVPSSINININVVPVGRIIGKISNSLCSPFRDSRVQNMYV